MREIKFRQAVYDRKGNFAHFHYWGFIDGSFQGAGTGVCSIADAQANSRQYTGLKDANGMEIYNGDIVEIDGGLFVDGKNVNQRYLVDLELCDTGLVPVNANKSTSLPYAFKNINSNLKIIGNIHENPELINQ